MFEPGVPRPRRAVVLELAVVTGVLALLTAVYFVTPVYPEQVGWAWIFIGGFALGIVVISALVVHEVRRYRLDRARGLASAVGLAVSLYLAVLFFAAVYFGLNSHLPAEIAGLRTKLDALYFALSVTTTVGFGDVHAQGQIARGVACLHMAFNVGFLGVAVAAVRSGSRS